MISNSSANLPAGALEEIKQRFFNSQSKLGNWMKTNAIEIEELRQFSYKMLTALSLVGQIAFHQPVQAQVAEQVAQIAQQKKDSELAKITFEERTAIIEKMQGYVQSPPGHLPAQEEKYLEQQLTDMFGFEVTAELEGNRLNHSIGIMGGEQHLARFPGDTLDQHDAVLEAGMAQNRGAFGWFSQSSQLSHLDIMREKYYFAVQTLYLPDWNTKHPQLKPWYKFRKMLMVNPTEALAVVGVVADAGPSLWVKKQFGASPEIMREAKVWSKEARGRVILYFIDDPEDHVPLGVYDLHTGQYLTNNLSIDIDDLNSEQVIESTNDE